MNATVQPLLSVCIANYNGANCIGECIESVFSQHDAPPFELIVHDDASSDDSLSIIRSFPQARLLESATNSGFCASNNRMVQATRGSLILLLNNDTVLLAGALRAIADLLQQDQKTGIVTLTQYSYETGELLDRGMLLDPFLNPIPVVDCQPDSLGMVMGSCLAIRRPLWDAAGGFPVFFGSIAEDMYLCLHTRMLGFRIACAASSGYRHRVGNSFGGGKLIGNRLQTNYKRRALSERNKTFNIYLFYPFPVLALILPLHLICLLLEGSLLSLLARTINPLRLIYVPAIAELWKSLPQLQPLRCRILRSSTIGIRQFLRPFRIVPWKLMLLWRHGTPRIDG